MSAEGRTGNMKTRLWKIISGIAFATVLASTTQISALAEPKEKQRGIEGVWHVTVTVVQCDTGNPILTGQAVIMFSDGGFLTEIADNHLHSTGLGTWRHVEGPRYTATDYTFFFNADDTFAGTQVVSRDIDLSANADEYTAAATFNFFDPNNQLVRSGCATATAARLG
jgi:hypothetical protein